MARRRTFGKEGDLALRYRRAAEDRLKAARLLLQHNFCLDAMYLAGYVAECALKALILRRTTSKDVKRVFSDISRGARAHNLEQLKSRVRARGQIMPDEVAEGFTRLASWSTDLRYQVREVESTDAKRVVLAATAVYDWVKRNW